MKVLLVHNRYCEPGGEDVVFESERTLLAMTGHRVVSYERSNREIRHSSAWRRLLLAGRLVRTSCADGNLRQLLRDGHPDVVHFHNIFPLISPGAYYAARESRVPVVQSIHNPRLLCPAGTLTRGAHLCTACAGKRLAWAALMRGCYRNSRWQTAAVAVMNATHWWRGTWSRLVDIYVTLTEFYRNLMVGAGLPASKIAVKPHFVHPDPGARAEHSGEYALFVGRLEEAKGVRTLLGAWAHLPRIPLKIRGDGPLLERVREFSAKACGTVEVVGWLPKEELNALMKGARFLVWPSEGYYESFGLVAIEAFANGVPVIAADAGSMREIVSAGRTGLLFQSGNPEDLAAKVEWAWLRPSLMAEMGQEARREYEAKYTAERNYAQLMAIYRQAIERAKSSE